MSEPRKLLNIEIDALPLKAWLVHRFGIGHRLTFAWVAIVLVLWATNFQLEGASNPVQAFVLLVLFPMAFMAMAYGADAAVAIGYRLGWTSHRSLMASNAPHAATFEELGEQLKAEARAEEAQLAQLPVAGSHVAHSPAAPAPETAAADRNRERALTARRVLYVVGIPAALVVFVGITVAVGGFRGGETWVLLGVLGLLIAVAPTISAWRAEADEPLPDLSDLDARLARNDVARHHGPDPIDPRHDA